MQAVYSDRYCTFSIVRLKRLPLRFALLFLTHLRTLLLPLVEPLTAVVVVPEQRGVVHQHVAAIVELLAADRGLGLELAAQCPEVCLLEAE